MHLINLTLSLSSCQALTNLSNNRRIIPKRSSFDNVENFKFNDSQIFNDSSLLYNVKSFELNDNEDIEKLKEFLYGVNLIFAESYFFVQQYQKELLQIIREISQMSNQYVFILIDEYLTGTNTFLIQEFSVLASLSSQKYVFGLLLERIKAFYNLIPRLTTAFSSTLYTNLSYRQKSMFYFYSKVLYTKFINYTLTNDVARYVDFFNMFEYLSNGKTGVQLRNNVYAFYFDTINFISKRENHAKNLKLENEINDFLESYFKIFTKIQKENKKSTLSIINDALDSLFKIHGYDNINPFKLE